MLSDILLATNCAVGAITLVGTAWNSYQHKSTRLLLAELKLNMMKEFNGRYITINRFEDLKDRVKSLEQEVHNV